MKTIRSTQMGSPSPPSRTSTLSSAPNYPCPSDVSVADFVPLKLCPTNYFVWKQLMLNFIESRGLVGFVDDTIQPPSLPEGKEKEEDYMSWKEKEEEYKSWQRSDNLVRMWISVMVTEKILQIVVRLKTAREVWNALEKMFTLPFQQSVDEFDCKDQEKRKILSQYVLLHKAALNGDWDTATKFLDKDPPEGIRDAITWCSETALMVAVRSAKRNHFVKKLMDKMSREDVAQLDMVGATALHVAVDGSNIEAVKWLVKKNFELPNIGDKNGTFALHIAAGHGNREMVVYLLKVTKDDEDLKPFEGEPGLRLLNDLASSGLYDIASSFLQSHPKLASMEPSPLVILATQRSSFRSGTRLNFLQRLIYDGIPLKSEGISNHHKGRDIENPADGIISSLDLRKKLHGMFWKVAEKLVPPVKSIWETKLIHHQALELVKSLCEGVVKSDFSKAGEIFIAPLRIATCLGIHEVVEEILVSFPSGIHLRSEKNQTIFHLAVIFRREKVFNIIYQLGEGRHRFLSMPDSTTNNALHLAGNLEPQQQLSLRASAAGAALQMQRELQWFKEVEKLILPQAREHMNAKEKTPLDVFTETHKDLVKEGEKWMKDTANSCTIVAALIATVVFAAAITVPGGTNGDTGLPIFLEDQAFILFGVSDALALFSSTASVLMFLSILTSRYGEQDFLYSLPRRLIIGLVTLFLSIISMMVAFGATLKIVFGDKKSWIVIPVAVLSCVPVTLFALLQFPLLLDMIQSTYYPGIFRKQSNRILD